MIRTKLVLGCALALLVSVTAVSTAIAQPADQRTYFTFSAPFELPGGKVLPAGRYTFKVADSPSNRHIIQIFSDDGKQIYATILAIPAQRQDPPDDPEVRFMETSAKMPPAIKTWWYPGRTIGHEFIYPKEQARRLAANQKESVLTVSGTQATAEEMQTADLSRISPSGDETAVRTETRTAEVRTPPPAPRTERVEPAPARTETARVESTRTELPRTASPLPLVGLVGLGSLVGAALVRLRRR